MADNGSNYSDKSFWQKVTEFALKAGREVIENALVLYYCLQDPDTPAWAKTVIIGALAYFILPTDAVPDFLPGGFVDDLGALAVALMIVAVHIKPEHREPAREKLKEWFGGDDDNLREGSLRK